VLGLPGIKEHSTKKKNPGKEGVKSSWGGTLCQLSDQKNSLEKMKQVSLPRETKRHREGNKKRYWRGKSLRGGTMVEASNKGNETESRKRRKTEGRYLIRNCRDAVGRGLAPTERGDGDRRQWGPGTCPGGGSEGALSTRFT